MKNISTTVQIITIYNILQTLYVTYLVGTSLPKAWPFVFIILFMVVANYFLVLGKKAAWTALFIWYILITFSFTSAAFYFSFSYGLNMSITINLNGIILGIDVLSLIILILHFSSKNDFKRQKRIDEIDQISGNHEDFMA